MKFVINSDALLSEFIGEIRATYMQHRYVRGSYTTGKHRSLDQSAISHVWFNQIAVELREDTPEGIKCFCKLHYGVPILRAEDSEFAEMYNACIKSKLTYEEKLQAMKYMPVSSIMTTVQISRYLEDIQKAFSTRGVILEFPKDERENPKRKQQ